MKLHGYDFTLTSNYRSWSKTQIQNLIKQKRVTVTARRQNADGALQVVTYVGDIRLTKGGDLVAQCKSRSSDFMEAFKKAFKIA